MSTFFERHRNRIIGLVAIVGFFSLLALEGGDNGPAAGSPAPSFELTVLDEERTISLEALRGRPVVLDFWATWCGPCREALPKLDAMAARYGDRAHFVTINSENEPAELLRRFRDQTSLSLPILIDGAQTSASYGVRAIPTTVLLDAEGRVARTFTGSVGERTLSRALDDLL